ncbi:MAG: sodium/solute symporter [Lentisphaerae bacterium]|nr:sodium/solute symporter [Lentisphaerota bacterium]
MNGIEHFDLHTWDYVAFGLYFVALSAIGWWSGRRRKGSSEEYFLAGRSLPWYVVGTSFIASNISSEHFIGMIGAAFIYGICVAMSEWGNIWAFSILIWFFIPFLLATKVFTTPEFMERRFNKTLRMFFAVVTVVSNVVAFLAAVLYGGGLALQSLFGWNLWVAIIALGVVAGAWAIYGGLRSVAWTDCFTVVVMIAGGTMVTVLGLIMLSGDSGSILEGWRVMLARNRAQTGIWAEVVAKNAPHIVQQSTYNRLSVIQPVTHQTTPWPSLFLSFLSISIWYNVINQFMIQRVLGAKNIWHARMGIVLAGYMKILMPLLVVVPGLILFAKYPEVMNLEWGAIRPEADKGYIEMLRTLVPIGLRGVFLAALFGAIQSTVNSVLNSTATIVTLDIYKRAIRPNAPDRSLVKVGMWTSVVILVISIVLARYIALIGGSLFVYIRSLYAFFAPPFAAVFLLGILCRRINAKGATVAVFAGFLFGILMKVYVQLATTPAAWICPYSMQAIVNWAFCVLVCVGVSLATAPPDPEQVTDELTLNWRKLNIFDGLGERWYQNVALWWGAFVLAILALVILFSGAVL